MAEWKRVRLGDVVSVNDEAYSSLDKWEFINYLDTGSVTENSITKIQRLEMGVDEIPSRARRKAYLGDIVYSTVRPNQRHYAILKAEIENLLVSTGFAVLRAIRSLVEPLFIYYYLSQDDVVAHLQLVAEQSVSTYPSLNPSDITNLVLSIPPLATQKKIAAVLGAIDDKIETNRKICANLEAQAQALFKSWFVDFEPFGGKMPKDWKMGTLGNVFVFKRGTAISKKDVSEVRDIKNKFVVYGAGRDVFGYSSKATIHEPSVLITAIGAGSGDVSRTHELSYSVTSNAFYVTPKVPSDFPYAYLRLKNFDFHLHCSGSAQPMLAYGAFENESIEAPTNKIINEFCKVVGPLLEMYDCSLAGINRLASMRDALLPRLMSGEIDVEKVEVA